MLPLKGLFDDTFMQNQTRLSKLGLQNSKRKNLAIKSMFLVEIFKDLKFCELKERLGHFGEIPIPPPSGGGSRICSITVKID